MFLVMNLLLITNNMDKCSNDSRNEDPLDNEYYGLNVLMIMFLVMNILLITNNMDKCSNISSYVMMTG